MMDPYAPAEVPLQQYQQMPYGYGVPPQYQQVQRRPPPQLWPFKPTSGAPDLPQQKQQQQQQQKQNTPGRRAAADCGEIIRRPINAS
jgi:hypothetical protein